MTKQEAKRELNKILIDAGLDNSSSVIERVNKLLDAIYEDKNKEKQKRR